MGAITMRSNNKPHDTYDDRREQQGGKKVDAERNDRIAGIGANGI